MEQRYVQLDRALVELLITTCIQAEHYCSEARPYDFEGENPPMSTYSESSGYAGACLRNVIQTLETCL